MTRISRKAEHLKNALALADGPVTTGFADLTLLHNCLPETDGRAVSLQTECAGFRLHHPVIINAMTGGAPELVQVNARLAEIALRTHSVLAVGSQFAAIQFPEVVDSFAVVRRMNPSGVIWANIGAYADLESSNRVVEMIRADALQVHLNAAQEACMTEGDSDYSLWLRNIEKMVRKSPVPVIVKETGCGMAMEQMKILSEIGVRALDVGGAGGTNFVAIETARAAAPVAEDFLTWGIPTAMSALEAAEVLPSGIDLIVSGGIRTPLDAMKAFAIGAVAVGMAAPFLRLSEGSGVENAVQWLENYLQTMKKGIMMLGHLSPQALMRHPIVITGQAAQWLAARGIGLEKYGRRSFQEEK